MKHNLKPSLIPLVLQVMSESTQAFGFLSTSNNCFCIEGVICEAYRRTHPFDAHWWPGAVNGFSVDCGGLTGFEIHNHRMPAEVSDWAFTRGHDLKIIDDQNRTGYGRDLNDYHMFSFADFTQVFTGNPDYSKSVQYPDNV